MKTLDDLGPELRLDLHIPPVLEFEIDKPPGRDGPPSDPWTRQPVPGPAENQPLEALRTIWGPEVPADQRKHLVIMQGAGSGKTILSLKMESLLSGGATSSLIFGDPRRRLVWHWSGRLPPGIKEGSDDLKDWLMADPFRWSGFAGDTSKKKQLVDYAWEQGRVIVILDGFDELSHDDRHRVCDAMNQSPVREAGPLWIITGRDSAIRDHQLTLFQSDRFHRLRIKEFTKEQQDRYMAMAAPHLGSTWRGAFFDNPSRDWEELLGLPTTLRELVRFLDLASPPNDTPRFSSPSDLHGQVSWRMLERELIKEKNAKRMENLNATLEGKLSPEDCCQLVERALGAVALEMALRGLWQAIFAETSEHARTLRLVKEASKQRFLLGLQEEVFPGKDREPIWQWALEFCENLELHNDSTLADMGKNVLGFRTRRHLELRAGQYLAKYATATDREGDPGQDLGGARDRSGDPSWGDLWKRAISMPLGVRNHQGDPKRYRNAVGLLFQRPVSPSQRRPTDLMWWVEGWARERLEKGDRCFERMEEHFHGILKAEFSALQNDQTKAEIIERMFDPGHFVLLADPQHSGLDGDAGHFMMGEKGKQNPVNLEPFLLCCHAVSVKFFSLFDDPFCDKEESDRARWGDLQQPAVYVSWYDSHYYTVFLKGQKVKKCGLEWDIRLVEEAEWEYGARAGSDGEYGRGKNGVEITEDNLSEYAVFGQMLDSGKPDAVDGGKKSNAWGFLHMFGNVWNWTASFGLVRPSRVSRGGGWSSRARDCRAACRGGGDPSLRGFPGGIRLAAGPSQGFEKQRQKRPG